MAEVLIIGLGSEILTDDSIGLRLVKNLSNDFNNNVVSVQTYLTYSLDVVEQLKNYKHVLIIDGIITGNAYPGTVYCWSCYEMLPTIHLSNFHDIPLTDALTLCKSIGWDMPESIDIIGVEIEDNITFSDELSRKLKSQYPTIKTRVKGIIENILKTKGIISTRISESHKNKDKIYFN